jgi:hypothetical protein
MLSGAAIVFLHNFFHCFSLYFLLLRRWYWGGWCRETSPWSPRAQTQNTSDRTQRFECSICLQLLTILLFQDLQLHSLRRAHARYERTEPRLPLRGLLGGRTRQWVSAIHAKSNCELTPFIFRCSKLVFRDPNCYNFPFGLEFWVQPFAQPKFRQFFFCTTTFYKMLAFAIKCWNAKSYILMLCSLFVVTLFWAMSSVDVKCLWWLIYVVDQCRRLW